MSWPINRWLLVSLFVFKGCQSLFLRHTQSGKCITTSEELAYNVPNYALPYFVVMTDNCLDNKAQFRYLDSELLHNIEKEGTLISPPAGHLSYKDRLAVYKGVKPAAINSQKNPKERLKQTAAGSLQFYKKGTICAEPSTKYVIRKTYCNRARQEFTFGSVTAYNAKMEDVHCSPIQRMVVKSADYGDFNNSGTFNTNANIDTTCSLLTSCQVKTLCGGKRSCQLIIDNNLLPSSYCSNISKEIYTEYTCVDSSNSTTITTASNIRLHYSPHNGFIEIKDGLTWRKVNETNWDKNRQKVLCQHLGFEETDTNNISYSPLVGGEEIATGDLICYYNITSNATSCCVHLQPSTTTSNVNMPYATCKICDKPILKNVSTFPVFSGSGSSDYRNARFSSSGWCASGSTPYLLIDLQKEYHITRVVVMGDRNQTKWSESYSMKYSHDKTLVDGSSAIQITGNQNGYQASTTIVDIYNVRHIKIQSTGSAVFCLRIELCGEVQTPAPVYDIEITPWDYSARVKLKLQTSVSASSYITQVVIYLNGAIHKYISTPRDPEIDITGLKPYTTYTIGIETGDGSSQKSPIVSKNFTTNETVPSGPPLNVTFSYRGKCSLNVSWTAPHESLWNGKLTGYLVCYSNRIKANNPRCTGTIKALSYAINNLQSSTKYFVTVSAATSVGDGPKSAEISKITNGEPVSPVVMSYSNLNIIITKPASYIREVIVIVQSGKSSPTPSENIQTRELKPYQTNTQNPYVTAYLKADVLPLTFVIGDGREYNSEKQKYFNQPLKQNSSYIVFLRFFESQNSYYSTEWSSTVNRRGLSGPPLNVVFKYRGKTSLQVSWKAPEENLKNGELTGYQVCFYTRDTAPECLVLTSTKVLSLTLNNLQPSTKYFVTVSASTKIGYGEKSLEISKITNGEPVSPLPTSYYTLSFNIPKPASYIREVMVIVQIVTSSQTPSENIKTSELKPYQTNAQDPYVTAYLKPNVLPLTFIIGDGNEYNSAKEKYFNQPLKQDSSYIVFLRLFESEDSYYSTEWSNSVKTMAKPLEQSSEDNKIRMDLLIPLVILALCFLLSLAVNIYQRRRLQNYSRKASHKPQTLRQTEHTAKFEPSNNNKSMKGVQAAEINSYVNDDAVYETPDNVIQCIERNEAESKPEIPTGQESSTYMSLKDNKEPGNFYQSLQPPGTSADSHLRKGGDYQAVEYENPAFNANFSGD